MQNTTVISRITVSLPQLRFLVAVGGQVCPRQLLRLCQLRPRYLLLRRNKNTFL
jgi:hypothetical protein